MIPADLTGRTFLITGANSGIGRALALALAERKARLVLAARSEERTRPVLDAIRRDHPGAEASFLALDLADFASVRAAAARALTLVPRLDVLVNNAGVAGTRGVSRDGFHVTYQVNHLGPFLFTHLLEGAVRAAPQGRIVNVSSVANYQVRAIDWSLLTTKPSRDRGTFGDYAATKLMNILHAKELARRLTGTAVTTYAVHPGGVATNIWRALPLPLQWLVKLFLISEEEGASTPLYCAADDALGSATGRYYTKESERPPNPLAEDTALAAELWRRSAEATGVPLA
ncbi:MAG: SDR family oxidoreductase [Gemmatimonadales bacterium]